MRKPSNMLLQRKRVSEKTREIVKRYSELYGNIQRMAEKIIPPIEMIGYKVTELDDPAELRQTAAWRMAQVPRVKNVALVKSLLIDSEPYVMQEAA